MLPLTGTQKLVKQGLSIIAVLFSKNRRIFPSDILIHDTAFSSNKWNLEVPSTFIVDAD